MSQRMRDPDQKKARELKRDHRVMPLRGDKSMRKTWRQKKALASRRMRRLQTAGLRRHDEPADDLTSGVNEVASQRRWNAREGWRSRTRATLGHPEEPDGTLACTYLAQHRGQGGSTLTTSPNRRSRHGEPCAAPQNKAMKLTKLSAAPLLGRQGRHVGRCRLVPAQASMDAGTASQLIASVLRTHGAGCAGLPGAREAGGESV